MLAGTTIIKSSIVVTASDFYTLCPVQRRRRQGGAAACRQCDDAVPTSGDAFYTRTRTGIPELLARTRC